MTYFREIKELKSDKLDRNSKPSSFSISATCSECRFHPKESSMLQIWAVILQESMEHVNFY